MHSNFIIFLFGTVFFYLNGVFVVFGKVELIDDFWIGMAESVHRLIKVCDRHSLVLTEVIYFIQMSVLIIANAIKLNFFKMDPRSL